MAAENRGRPAPSYVRPMAVDRFYYGATYYPEHWSAADRENDAARMAAAGFNCVRMAEFAWTVIEPEEGEFHFELFDDVIAELGEHGIFTILGTPTATPPRWLTFGHPEMLRVNADGVPMQHGSRQQACPSNGVFREHSRRITRAMAEHYADTPHVVGWQTDNELNCHFSECHCPACQAEFRAFLRRKYNGDIEALNAAWGNVFWSLTYGDFDEIPTPKNGKPAYANPAHLLDYYRFISWNTARFQHEQVEILRGAQPRWFVMHNGTFAHIDYRGPFGQDLDFLGYDVYPFFENDPERRPYTQAFALDQVRAWTGNFMVPEQQSGPGGQAPYLHDTPEPGEIRRMAYTSIAHGADSLLYFRWRTARFGAEEYWRGILDHDNVRRRFYQEVQQMGLELKRIAPEVLGTHVRVDVGIAAADVDVYDAHTTLPFGLPSPQAVAQRVHTALMRQGYAVGCAHPSDDLSALKVYIIPHWALFNAGWMPNLEAFVEGGGVLVIGARTATRDWDNKVEAGTPPAPFRRFAGVQVVEYGRRNAPDKRPLTARFFPGDARVPAQEWYEQVDTLPGTHTHARWEGRHLALKGAVVSKKVGAGAVIYVGTYLDAPMIEALLPAVQGFRPDLQPLWPAAPEGVHVVVREDDAKELWFIFNDTDQAISMSEMLPGFDLISDRQTRPRSVLQKHDIVILRKPIES